MSSRATLNRETVVAEAVARADRDGIDAVTMRSLADHLGVTPMALYKHVRDREDLLDGMVESVVAQIPMNRSTTTWRKAVRNRILGARKVFLAHPWAMTAIETRTDAGPAVLHHIDTLIGSLTAGGFSPLQAHDAIHVLSSRMWGFTREVTPTPALPTDPEERTAAVAALADQYPHLISMTYTTLDAGGCDTEAEFAFGLDLILDGLDAHLARAKSP